jgi:hypothetical protein
MGGYNLFPAKYASPWYRRRLYRQRRMFLICLSALCLLTVLSALPVLANRALPSDLSYNTETYWLLPGLPDLTATAGYIPHNFSQGEATFSWPGETVHGFRPGKAYSEMSLRSLAWSMETAQYYYPEAYLREPLEAYLRRQSLGRPGQAATQNGLARGAIGNTINSNGHLVKDISTSDEESSLIHAAYIYYNMTYNTAWLRQELQGATIIERLNLAAEWLYTQRLDHTRQLVWRGAGNDWGTPLAASESGASAGRPTQFSLYDQALAYIAFIELARMNAAIDDTGQADQWQLRAELLKNQSYAHLWQADQGLYQARSLISPPEAGAAEANRVTIVNALAVYSNLADPHQHPLIFKQLEAARLQAGAKKAGLSLYPYRPESRAGIKANGALWDWWAGLQIKAEFLSGFADTATIHLQQVANEWQHHPGNIIEWQSPLEADQEGSHYYSAAAGTVGSAIIEGFFGAQLAGNGLSLSPRLGLNDGFIRLYQPATDRYGAYSYDWDQDVTRIGYGTNAQGPVYFSVLKLRSEQIQDVTIDGHPVSFEQKQIGHDHFIVFTGPSGQHQINILKGPHLLTTELSSTERISNTEGLGSLPAEPAGPSSARNVITPHTAPAGDPLLASGPALIAPDTTPSGWLAFLHLISSGLILLTALSLILLVALRHLNR